MALELNTIGITLKYAPESTAGTRPTTFSNEVPNVTSIGELSGQPDQLECTDLKDTWKRYVAGVKDTGGDLSIGVNLTAAFRTAWEGAVTAYATAKAAGKALWWQVNVPTFGNFYVAGEPSELGLMAAEVNQVLTGTVHIIPNQVAGWASE